MLAFDADAGVNVDAKPDLGRINASFRGGVYIGVGCW